MDCADYIGNGAPPRPLQTVLGVVALPTSPRNPALQTSLSGNGPARLFAKTGLVVKAGATLEITAAPSFTRRLSIGWGPPGTPSGRIVIADCPTAGGNGWLSYAGGYWIDHPACVAVIVTANGRQRQVHIGLGTPCPRQQPLQAPSQS